PGLRALRPPARPQFRRSPAPAPEHPARCHDLGGISKLQLKSVSARDVYADHVVRGLSNSANNEDWSTTPWGTTLSGRSKGLSPRAKSDNNKMRSNRLTNRAFHDALTQWNAGVKLKLTS